MTMTRSSLGLCLSALSLMVFSIVPAIAQTPDTAQGAQTSDTAQNASTSDSSTQKSSHSHSDAAGLALLGALAGGASLMGGGQGSDGSSGISSDNSFAQSATAPEVIYTQPTLSVATDTPSPASVVISNPIPTIVSLPTTAPTSPIATETETTPSPVNVVAQVSPVVTVTYPTTASTPPVATSIVFSPQPTATPPLGIAPRSTLPLPVPSVPEPGTTATLVLGSLLIGGLALRTRRNARC